MNSKSNSQAMETEKIPRLLAQLAIPAVVAQIINLLYNIVDRIYIGHISGVGAAALTGVGLFTPILMLINAFAMLAGSGGAPRAAISMGKKDNKTAEKILGNCFALLILMAVILTVVFFTFAPQLLTLFGASEKTLPYGVAYARIYILGSIFVLIVMGMNPFITTQGFAKISMMTTVIGAVINIILDPIFIFVFNLGVRGAALATVLSQAVGAIWILRFLSGKKTILHLRKENFRLQSGQLYNKQIHVGKISALLNPLTYMIINLGIIAILWSGGKQVDLGYLTQGQIIALINYMSQILVELVKLANLLIILSRAFASLDRVDQIFALEPSMKETGKTDIEEKKDTPILEFKDTSFVYHGARKETIHPFDFAVKEGETIGVIGGTGSGKSTFVSLIARLYDVTSGRILYRGVDEKELKPEFIRGKIGFVPQKASLFEGSLRDNMKWGKEDATDEEIYQALDIAQAREFVDQKEQRLDFRIEQNGGNLSGGQKQRLTIARALVRKPEILILDDSASALDFATDARLRKAIKENTDNMTVFLVSQRVSTIRNADHILVLDDGKIAGIGTHLQLLKENQVYKEICASQMAGEEA